MTAKSGSKEVVIAAYIKAGHKVSSLLTSQLIFLQPRAVRCSLLLPEGRHSCRGSSCAPRSLVSEAQTQHSCQGWKSSAFPKGWRNSSFSKARLISPFSSCFRHTHGGIWALQVCTALAGLRARKQSGAVFSKCLTLRPKSVNFFLLPFKKNLVCCFELNILFT